MSYSAKIGLVISGFSMGSLYTFNKTHLSP
jgi:hypothetical protein